MKKLRLARVILFAANLDTMVAFYRDLIGLPVASAEPGFVCLDGGGASLALHAIGKGRAVVPKKPAPARKDAVAKIVFLTTDPDAAMNELEAHGVRPLRRMTSGKLILRDGLDPEGNVFQISNRV